VWTTYGEALRKPVGRIYWAGTETATRWSGYFDGGVRAGEDAAQAILDQF
jgi:monoamine oxidase